MKPTAFTSVSVKILFGLCNIF